MKKTIRPGSTPRRAAGRRQLSVDELKQVSGGVLAEPAVFRKGGKKKGGDDTKKDAGKFF